MSLHDDRTLRIGSWVTLHGDNEATRKILGKLHTDRGTRYIVTCCDGSRDTITITARQIDRVDRW